MLIKYWSLKKYHMAKTIHLNTLLDMMIEIFIRPLLVKLPKTTSYINKFKLKKQK